MPLPEPKSGESKMDFVGRCKNTQRMKDEYPEEDQREAVCFKQWEENRNDAAADAARKAAGVADA